MSRKGLLGLACILWSATTFGAGAVNSFGFFCLMRFALGGFESACNPASYSLIADYFPVAYRSTANAIETSGSYVGGGLASLSIILIKKYGWRVMYQILGGVGVLMGLATLVLVREPGRGVFDFKDQFKVKFNKANPIKKEEVKKEVVKDTRGPF